MDVLDTAVLLPISFALSRPVLLHVAKPDSVLLGATLGVALALHKLQRLLASLSFTPVLLKVLVHLMRAALQLVASTGVWVGADWALRLCGAELMLLISDGLMSPRNLVGAAGVTATVLTLSLPEDSRTYLAALVHRAAVSCPKWMSVWGRAQPGVARLDAPREKPTGSSPCGSTPLDASPRALAPHVPAPLRRASLRATGATWEVGAATSPASGAAESTTKGPPSPSLAAASTGQSASGDCSVMEPTHISAPPVASAAPFGSRQRVTAD